MIYSATSETEFLRFSSTAHILVRIGVGTGIFTAQAIHLPRSQGALISIPRGSLGPLSGWVGRIDRIVFLEAGANVVGSGAGRVYVIVREFTKSSNLLLERRENRSPIPKPAPLFLRVLFTLWVKSVGVPLLTEGNRASLPNENF